jgi:two-component system sensor histidine kinase DegS
MQVELAVKGEKRDLPTEMKTTLFRIAQEALTNAIKHANAENAKVNLEYARDGVRLAILDDGVGFNPSRIHTATRPSWGLVGMEERTALLNGEFKISSSPGKGTIVNVYIPYIDDTGGAHDEDASDAG